MASRVQGPAIGSLQRHNRRPFLSLNSQGLRPKVPLPSGEAAMTGSTPFQFPRPGAALIEEARAARQAAQRNEQEERVKAHVRAILSRLKSRRPSPSQNPPQDPRL